MKTTLKERMPLAAVIMAVAVPLLLFGLHWHWLPIAGYPVPVPF